MNPLLVVMQKEFMDGRRNRWLQSITVLLFFLALGIAYLGGAVAGQIGFTGLSNTIVSLASLAVLIMPLIALLLSYDAIVGEDESGTLLLLSAYPIRKRDFFLGKWLGRCAVLAVSLLLGFGSAALVLLFTTDTEALPLISAFAVFIVSALLLGMSFAAVGMWISSISRTRTQAAGIALIVWFFTAVLFDLLLLGGLVLTQGQVDSWLLAGVLLLNPTDVFRMMNFWLFQDMQTHTGLMQIQQDVGFHLVQLLLAAIAWVVAPLGLAYYQFKHWQQS